MADNTERPGLINVTGLWPHKSAKDGSTFYSGNAGSLTFMVFPVKNRTNPNSPEYNLTVTQNTPRPENGNGEVTVTETIEATATEDDLPF